MWGKGLGDSANTPTLVYVLKGCSPCLSLSPTLSVLRSEMHNLKSRNYAKAFRATCLTRSVLVLCGLGSAGAASHHGRLCDGARRPAVCVRASNGSLVSADDDGDDDAARVCTHPLCACGTSGLEEGFHLNWRE